jgi:hypothetical protein
LASGVEPILYLSLRLTKLCLAVLSHCPYLWGPSFVHLQ